MGCSNLTLLSLHNNPLTADQLREVEGFAALDGRRQLRIGKQVCSSTLCWNLAAENAGSTATPCFGCMYRPTVCWLKFLVAMKLRAWCLCLIKQPLIRKKTLGWLSDLNADEGEEQALVWPGACLAKWLKAWLGHESRPRPWLLHMQPAYSFSMPAIQKFCCPGMVFYGYSLLWQTIRSLLVAPASIHQPHA